LIYNFFEYFLKLVKDGKLFYELIVCKNLKNGSVIYLIIFLFNFNTGD